MTRTEHTLIREDADGNEREIRVVVEGRCYPAEPASEYDPGCRAYADIERVTLAGTEGGCIWRTPTPGEREELEEALLRQAASDDADDEARRADDQLDALMDGSW